jgi:hypothetical protein
MLHTLATVPGSLRYSDVFQYQIPRPDQVSLILYLHLLSFVYSRRDKSANYPQNRVQFYYHAIVLQLFHTYLPKKPLNFQPKFSQSHDQQALKKTKKKYYLPSTSQEISPFSGHRIQNQGYRQNYKYTDIRTG